MKIAPPGRILNGLHVWASGAGSPVVVLEAGIAASSVSWSLVQPKIAEFTRVLSYDRAGFGWSVEASANSGTALDAAMALNRMIESSGERGPFVLAGHSFGALIVRIFQQQFPDRVAGLVLVDPVVRSDWRDDEGRRRMLNRGVLLSRRGAWLARMGVVRLALRMLTSGSHRAPRLMARLSAGNGAGVTDRLAGEVRKMPREHWPAIAQHWSDARSFLAMADNLDKLPLSVTQVDETRGLDDVPIVVLSAGKRIAEHGWDAGLSSRGENVVVAGSGHWMQLDAPEAVVSAIRRVVEEVRGR
jgi:pimeloyl-ACP methyl ester carboxylesterase